MASTGLHGRYEDHLKHYQVLLDDVEEAWENVMICCVRRYSLRMTRAAIDVYMRRSHFAGVYRKSLEREEARLKTLQEKLHSPKNMGVPRKAQKAVQKAVQNG